MGSLCAGISLYHWSFLSSGSFELVVRFGTYCGMIGSAISTLFLSITEYQYFYIVIASSLITSWLVAFLISFATFAAQYGVEGGNLEILATCLDQPTVRLDITENGAPLLVKTVDQLKLNAVKNL